MHHLSKVKHVPTNGMEFDSDFAQDVFLGLTHSPKWLSSKYFYDANGDRIFQQIMQMESYYLTDAELNIFRQHKDDILRRMYKGAPFRLIELGAGDGKKTKVLLKHFLDQNIDFEYSPCDISGNVLSILEKDMSGEFPELHIKTLVGDYFEALSTERLKSEEKSVILFLGSNIGNFSHQRAVDFLRKVRSNMNISDQLMIGFDLKKDPNTILKAYNDPEGTTARFNLNLLERINRELEADFDPQNFMHHPMYDPSSGECKSFLLSMKNHEVYIKAIDSKFHFDRWEAIFTEISRKYGREEITSLCDESGFQVLDSFYDGNNYFVDDLWEAI